MPNPVRVQDVAYNPDSGRFIKTMSNGEVRTTPGSRTSAGYLSTQFEGRPVKAHRLAVFLMTGHWPDGDIDHINGDPLDNRWANLRVVQTRTNVENQRRAQRNNRSGLLGVSHHGDRFQARITVHGSTVHLGTFSTPEEAHQAYLKAKRELHEGCTI